MKPSPEKDAALTLSVAWDEHRTTLRRLLIAWTRDIDLADDLLQDTYLRAQAGIHTYRGGDAHAWLTAIAKNVFYSHCRKHRSSEIFDETFMGEPSAWAGSAEHLYMLAIREAIQALTPAQQKALILRHYGDLSYQQIAKHCGCPAGTARQRVWTAIRRIQQMLGSRKELTAMSCHYVKSIQLLEYLYGALPAERHAGVKAHIEGYKEAQQELRQLQEVMSSLNRVAGDFLLFYLAELDDDGVPTYYTWGRMTNMTDQPQTHFVMINSVGSISDFAAFQGEAIALEPKPWEQDPSRLIYVAQLPHPVMPGESFDGMVVSHDADHAIEITKGHWRFSKQLGLGGQREATIIVKGIRLPRGAELLATNPPADTVKQGDAITVFWHLMPAPDEPMDISVEYRR